MSLVVFNGLKPPETPPGEQIYSVVLNNINTLVIHNQETNEVSLVSPSDYPFDLNDPEFKRRTCPHCGARFDEARRSGSPRRRNSSTTTIALADSQSPLGDDGEAMSHGNYFRLLEDTFRLPDTLFTQGYFDKFFKEIEMVGRGSRGSVYKVEHILNGVSLGTFALKKITIGQDPLWLSKILKEVHMLVKISCNTHHLVNYNHVWLEVDSINEFGPKVPCAFILQQYCSGGNLEDLVTSLKDPKLSVKEMKRLKIRKLKGRLLSNEEIVIMFKSIVKGVAELHKHHIIHRDLKPSNCLLSAKYSDEYFFEPDLEKIPDVLIGDFGESQLEGETRSGTGATGTLEYTAPELLDVYENIQQFNKKTDVYSLGMILMFMCFGGAPFKSTDLNDLKREIMADIKIGTREGLHPGLIEIIKNLTSHTPNDRMDAEEILERLAWIEEDLDPAVSLVSSRLSLTHNAESPPLPLAINRKRGRMILLYSIQCIVLVACVLMRTDLKGWRQILSYALVFLNGMSFQHPPQLSITVIIWMILFRLLV